MKSALLIFSLITLNSAFAIDQKNKIHNINCITLNKDYKPDGGSFDLRKSVSGKASSDAISNIKNVAILQGWELQNLKHKVCKRKGMENSKDFENSYEICGFSSKLSSGNEKDELVIESGFNIKEDACSALEEESLVQKLRAFVIKDFVEVERLKLEQANNKVGHIFIYKDGRLDPKSIVRIQCESRSNNGIHVEGANH